MKQKPLLYLLLMVIVWGGGIRVSYAGVVWDYRGLDWMISASSDIVIATEVPQESRQPHRNAKGKPIITGLPDVANGTKWKIIIQHVLKGELEIGKHVDVFLATTGYMGNHPVEFPTGSADVMFALRDKSVILFLHRTGNKPVLETLPCFGSSILADPNKLDKIVEKPELKDTILNLIEQKPKQPYPSFSIMAFGSDRLNFYAKATVAEVAQASEKIIVVGKASTASDDISTSPEKLSEDKPQNLLNKQIDTQWNLQVFGVLKGPLRSDTTLTIILNADLEFDNSEKYLVFFNPTPGPYKELNSVFRVIGNGPFDKQTSESLEQAIYRLTGHRDNGREKIISH